MDLHILAKTFSTESIVLYQIFEIRDFGEFTHFSQNIWRESIVLCQVFEIDILMDLHILGNTFSRESIFLWPNFRNGDFDGFTYFEIPRVRKAQ